MAYATQADIEARYPGELAQAGPRDPAGNLDPAAIALACEEASAKADGYLRVSPAGITVPLAPPAPVWLTDLVVDIALYQAVSYTHLDVYKRQELYLISQIVS